MNRIFIFSCTWGLAGCLDVPDRKKFVDKFKNLLEQEEIAFPNNVSLFDIVIDFKSGDYEFKKWTSFRPSYVHPENGEFSKILVPTDDTFKYSWLTEKHFDRAIPFCIIGDTGVSKTVVLKD